jgi:hypothetical protein
LSVTEIVEIKVILFKEYYKVRMQGKCVNEAANSVGFSKQGIGIKRKEKLSLVAKANYFKFCFE